VEKPKVFTKMYDLVGWILERTNTFPKSHRFVFSERINNLVLDILENIIEAIISQEKVAILQTVNVNLEKLRVLIRLSKDQHFLSFKQYEYASRMIDEVGRMLAGWKRYPGSLKAPLLQWAMFSCGYGWLELPGRDTQGA